jgi:preprotein translocase subunit SecF
MFQIFPNINVDWMGLRKPFVFISIAVLLAGLISAGGRQLTEGGTDAFNLGVDFQGGTVITVKFREKPGPEQIRAALNNVGVTEPIIQDSTDKTDEVLIKIPIVEGRDDIGAPAATEQAPAEQPVDANANTAGTAPGDQPASPAGTTQVERGRQIVKSALDTFGREAAPARCWLRIRMRRIRSSGPTQ